MKIKVIDVPRHLATSFIYYLSPLHDIELKSHSNIADVDLHADIWIINLRYIITLKIEEQQKIFKVIDKFCNKICYVEVTDSGIGPAMYAQYQNFFDRVYCAFLRTETDFTRLKFKRRILYPKFTVDYIPPLQTTKKNKTIFFRGSLTGGKKMNGRNHRLEAMQIIDQLGCSWLDCQLFVVNAQLKLKYVQDFLQEEPTKSFIESLPSNIIDPKEVYLNQLANSKTSLCLPGGAVWCYRHLESMALNCNIISISIDYDPGFWLGRNKLDECFNILNFDLSNLKEVCEYTLSDDKLLKDKRDYAYHVYQQEYELTANNIYKFHVWKRIYELMLHYKILDF